LVNTKALGDYLVLLAHMKLPHYKLGDMEIIKHTVSTALIVRLKVLVPGRDTSREGE